MGQEEVVPGRKELIDKIDNVIKKIYSEKIVNDFKPKTEGEIDKYLEQVDVRIGQISLDDLESDETNEYQLLSWLEKKLMSIKSSLGENNVSAKELKDAQEKVFYAVEKVETKVESLPASTFSEKFMNFWMGLKFLVAGLFGNVNKPTYNMAASHGVIQNVDIQNLKKELEANVKPITPGFNNEKTKLNDDIKKKKELNSNNDVNKSNNRLI